MLCGADEGPQGQREHGLLRYVEGTATSNQAD